MKKIILLSTMAACAAVNSAYAGFSTGDLAVFQVGDGSAALTSAGTAVFIDDYSAGGSLLNSFAVATTGANALVVSGSATSEGALSMSPDGLDLVFAGYNTALPHTGVASSTTPGVPRGYGTVDLSGAYTLQGTTTQYSGNNVRSATTDSAGNFWMGGTPNGVVNGTTATVVQTANIRVVSFQNGNLSYSTGSGTRGIYTFAGSPTGTATPATTILTGASSSPYAFALNTSLTIAYVADDSLTSAGGGIQKWTFSGGAWSLAYTLDPDGTLGARGLSVDFSGVNPVIYATTTETSQNKLVEITDTGAGSTPTTLATAGLNEVFRGVQIVPEPGTLTLMSLGAIGGLLLRRRKQ